MVATVTSPGVICMLCFQVQGEADSREPSQRQRWGGREGQGRGLPCCVVVCDIFAVFAAAKAAVHRFTQSREAMQREKDLLKTVKVFLMARANPGQIDNSGYVVTVLCMQDNDLSRYIPGKVKMSLPQGHKHQRR